MTRVAATVVGILLEFGLAVGPAPAATCQDPAGFAHWLETIKGEAAARGISSRAIAALDGITPNSQVLSLDRSQTPFKLSFEQFANERINARLSRGASLLRSNASLFASIEQRFGVPGPVLVAIWGLETDFGANTGSMSSLRSLATLAHDCRRTDRFQAELLAALTIIDRGDMSADQMRGAWAGELGQTQFLATNYVKFAVDFDGNGRRDLIRSVPDALASTANYLRSYGWRAGADWMPGAPNFPVLQQWNQSDIYSRTIALFAAKLAGR